MSIEHSPSPLEPYATNLEWLSQYVVGSYYFSQGDPELQYDLDKYAAMTHSTLLVGMVEIIAVNPGTFVSAASLVKAAGGVIGDMFKNGRHEDFTPEIDSEVFHRYKSLIAAVRNVKDHSLQPEHIDAILEQMIQRERRFLIQNTASSVLRDTRRSPHSPRYGKSILLDVLLHDFDPAHPVFVYLFASMRQHLKTDTVAATVQAQLTKIETVAAGLSERPVRDVAVLFS